MSKNFDSHKILPLQPPRLTISIISGTALAYEILLMRLFSIVQFHHFAYMVISLALLGFGASGTFLSIAREKLLANFQAVFLANIVLFGVAVPFCFLAAQTLQFNPEEILWTAAPFLKILLVFLLLALPFFFAASAVALALARFPQSISRIYAADLIGAGLGSIFIIVLLFLVFPDKALSLLASLILCGAGIAWWETGMKPLNRIFFFLVLATLPLAAPNNWTTPLISPYKGLAQQMLLSGSKILTERSSPLGWLTVLENKVVPFRYAPGLSLNATVIPPEQLGIFTDGDSLTVITKQLENQAGYGYLDQTTTALPYHLQKPEQILILGAGGGVDLLLAKYHQVPKIDAVELNHQLVDLVVENYGFFSGDLFKGPRVNLYTKEARGFVEKTATWYDLIQLSLLDSFSASSAGLYALSENYLYTVEAFQKYFHRLQTDGILSISRWLKLPPRDTFKLLATAVKALEKEGIPHPGQHLVLIRGWQTSTLLIKKSRITDQEIAALKRFCSERSFDVAYYPGMATSEANQFNVLREPFFYEGAQTIINDRHSDAFFDQYKFHIRPATDNTPYFFHFFKWQLLPEIIALRGQGGMALVESGYLVLVATLVQALTASLILILLPLLFLKRRLPEKETTAQGKWQIFVYFSAIGLAFLFLEIAFIQRFILFLSHPLYAVTVVLASFLIFAGFGSAFSKKIIKEGGKWSGITLPVAAMTILVIVYLLSLNTLFAQLFGLSDVLKIIVSILLIAPLAFFMGMPFPAALTRVGDSRPWLVPWAWGVNGCASVISAVLATMLAIQFGFTTVVLLALALYCVAAMTSLFMD